MAIFLLICAACALGAYLFRGLAAIVFVLTPVILAIAAYDTVVDIYRHKTGQAAPPPRQVERVVDFRSKVDVLAFDHTVEEKEGFDANRYVLHLRGRLHNGSAWKVGKVGYECQWKDTWNQRDERFASSVYVGLAQDQEGEFTERVPLYAVASRGDVMGKQFDRGLVYHRCRVTSISPVIGG